MRFNNQSTFNGRQITNVVDRPVLHKKGKQWITIGLSTLLLAGLGTVATTGGVHAANIQNNNVNSNNINKINSNATPNSAKPSTITSQATNLHKQILNNSAMFQHNNSSATKPTVAPTAKVNPNSTSSNSTDFNNVKSNVGATSNNNSDSNASTPNYIENNAHYNLGSYNSRKPVSTEAQSNAYQAYLKANPQLANLYNETANQSGSNLVNNSSVASNAPKNNVSALSIASNSSASSVSANNSKVSSANQISDKKNKPLMKIAMLGGTQLQDNNIVQSGNWGTAKWELSNTGNLNIHDGTVDNSNANGHNGHYSDDVHNYVYQGGIKDNIHNLDFSKINSITTNNLSMPKDGDVGELFQALPNVKTIDLSGIITEPFSNFNNTFSADLSLEKVIGLDKFADGSSSVGIIQGNPGDNQNFDGMFNGDKKLKSVDLSHFDASNSGDFNGLCSGCSDLETVNLGGKFTVKSGTNVSNIFSGDGNITHLILNDKTRLANPQQGEYSYGYNNQDGSIVDIFDNTPHEGDWTLINTNNPSHWDSASWVLDKLGGLHVANGKISRNLHDAQNLDWSKVNKVYFTNVSMADDSNPQIFNNDVNDLVADKHNDDNNATNINKINTPNTWSDVSVINSDKNTVNNADNNVNGYYDNLTDSDVQSANADASNASSANENANVENLVASVDAKDSSANATVSYNDSVSASSAEIAASNSANNAVASAERTINSDIDKINNLTNSNTSLSNEVSYANSVAQSDVSAVNSWKASSQAIANSLASAIIQSGSTNAQYLNSLKAQSTATSQALARDETSLFSASGTIDSLNSRITTLSTSANTNHTNDSASAHNANSAIASLTNGLNTSSNISRAINSAEQAVETSTNNDKFETQADFNKLFGNSNSASTISNIANNVASAYANSLMASSNGNNETVSSVASSYVNSLASSFASYETTSNASGAINWVNTHSSSLNSMITNASSVSASANSAMSSLTNDSAELSWLANSESALSTGSSQASSNAQWISNNSASVSSLSGKWTSVDSKINADSSALNDAINTKADNDTVNTYAQILANDINTLDNVNTQINSLANSDNEWINSNSGSLSNASTEASSASASATNNSNWIKNSGTSASNNAASASGSTITLQSEINAINSLTNTNTALSNEVAGLSNATVGAFFVNSNDQLINANGQQVGATQSPSPIAVGKVGSLKVGNVLSALPQGYHLAPNQKLRLLGSENNNLSSTRLGATRRRPMMLLGDSQNDPTHATITVYGNNVKYSGTVHLHFKYGKSDKEIDEPYSISNVVGNSITLLKASDYLNKNLNGFDTHNFIANDNNNYQSFTIPSTDGKNANNTVSKDYNLTFNAQPVNDSIKYILSSNNIPSNYTGKTGQLGSDTINGTYDTTENNNNVFTKVPTNYHIVGTPNTTYDGQTHDIQIAPNNETVKVIYTDQNKKTYSDNVNGQYDQKTSDITKSYALPNGYYVNNDQNNSYIFSGDNNQTKKLNITGNTVSSTFTLTIKKFDGTTPEGSYNKQIIERGEVGNQFTIKPSDSNYQPTGYATQNKVFTGTFTPTGLSSNDTTFTYNANKGAVITVNYVDQNGKAVPVKNNTINGNVDDTGTASAKVHVPNNYTLNSNQPSDNYRITTKTQTITLHLTGKSASDVMKSKNGGKAPTPITPQKPTKNTNPASDTSNPLNPNGKANNNADKKNAKNGIATINVVEENSKNQITNEYAKTINVLQGRRFGDKYNITNSESNIEPKGYVSNSSALSGVINSDGSLSNGYTTFYYTPNASQIAPIYVTYKNQAGTRIDLQGNTTNTYATELQPSQLATLGSVGTKVNILSILTAPVGYHFGSNEAYNVELQAKKFGAIRLLFSLASNHPAPKPASNSNSANASASASAASAETSASNAVASAKANESEAISENNSVNTSKASQSAMEIASMFANNVASASNAVANADNISATDSMEIRSLIAEINTESKSSNSSSQPIYNITINNEPKTTANKNTSDNVITPINRRIPVNLYYVYNPENITLHGKNSSIKISRRRGFTGRIIKATKFNGKRAYVIRWHHKNYVVNAKEVRNAYIQVKDFNRMAHGLIKHATVVLRKNAKIYKSIHFNKATKLANVKAGSKFTVVGVKTFGKKGYHQTRLVLSNGCIITANRNYVKFV